MATGSQARNLLPLLEEVYGKGVKDPFNKLNRARSFLWSIADIREEFFEDRGCAYVQAFTHQCRSDCNTHWLGITMPVDIASVKSLSYNGSNIKISTRDSFDPMLDVGSWCACPEDRCLEAMTMGRDWVLPRDPCETDCWVFEAENTEDDKSKVGISYFDVHGRRHREDVVLNRDEAGTSYPVASLDTNGLTLPRRCGKITVMLAKSREVIAEWDSDVDAPKYQRLAIKGVAPGQPIRWRGTRRPARIQYPTDFVEFGVDEELWRNVLMAQNLHFNTNKSAGESRSYNMFVSYIVGTAQSYMNALNPEYEFPTINAASDWDDFTEAADRITGGCNYGY